MRWQQILPVSLTNHTGGRMAQDVKLAVAICQVESDCPACLSSAFANLGQFELNTARDIDPNAVLVTAMRGANRIAGRVEDAGD